MTKDEAWAFLLGEVPTAQLSDELQRRGILCVSPLPQTPLHWPEDGPPIESRTTSDAVDYDIVNDVLVPWGAEAQAALAANLPTDVMLVALKERGALHSEHQLSAGAIPVYRVERRWVTPWEATDV
jgi:hypothetical protein